MRRLKDGTPIMEFKTEEDIHLAKSYFGTLRQMIDELREIPIGDIGDILDDYHVEFVDVGDGIPRVGIDNPKWRK
ncbi:MAG: hypothetical protein GTN80_03680 [Nitrososphaeria archaeon]|nr:hypothetical protein [Nitrososphaeria archaeon]NIQ32732.1 hypothetical protein [Nitrososphaeria archaeon]